jgi:hypothetical protein
MKFVLKNITIISLILLTATSVCFRKLQNEKVKTEKPGKFDNEKGQGLNDSKIIPTKVDSETESSKSSDLSRKNSLKDDELSSEDDLLIKTNSAQFPHKSKAFNKKSNKTTPEFNESSEHNFLFDSIKEKPSDLTLKPKKVKSFTDDDIEKQSNIFFPSSKDDLKTKKDKTSKNDFSLKLNKVKSFVEDEKSNARKTNLAPLDVSNSIELNRESNDPQTPRFGNPDGFIKGSNISFGKKKKL